jgi:hypothetical protein
MSVIAKARAKAKAKTMRGFFASLRMTAVRVEEFSQKKAGP